MVKNAKKRQANPYIYLEEIFKHVYNFHSESDKWNYFVTGFNAQTMNIFINFDEFIKDRFHLSEYVFSKFMNRVSTLPFELIDSTLSSLNKQIVVVYLTTTYETYIKRVSGNKDKEIYVWKEHEFDKLQLLFSEAYSKTKLNKIQIATDESTIAEITEDIDNYIFDMFPISDFDVRR